MVTWQNGARNRTALHTTTVILLLLLLLLAAAAAAMFLRSFPLPLTRVGFAVPLSEQKHLESESHLGLCTVQHEKGRARAFSLQNAQWSDIFMPQKQGKAGARPRHIPVDSLQPNTHRNRKNKLHPLPSPLPLFWSTKQ